jgi:hypothetical protein
LQKRYINRKESKKSVVLRANIENPILHEFPIPANMRGFMAALSARRPITFSFGVFASSAR